MLIYFFGHVTEEYQVKTDIITDGKGLDWIHDFSKVKCDCNNQTLNATRPFNFSPSKIVTRFGDKFQKKKTHR